MMITTRSIGRGAARSRRWVSLGVGLTMIAALGACGDDDDSDAAGTDASAAASVEVENAWSRTSPAMTTAGAVYLTLTSADGDRLVAAAVPTTVAAKTEIHETVVAESGDMTDTTAMAAGDTAAPAMSDTTAMGGTEEMTMRPIDGLDLPAGTAVVLEPGGYHIMLLDLVAPLELGTEISLTLTFEQAGEQTVSVPVLAEAP
ncbi:MAG: copper chaperone PCu(A)C [Acidimicrobiia bacterium]